MLDQIGELCKELNIPVYDYTFEFLNCHRKTCPVNLLANSRETSKHDEQQREFERKSPGDYDINSSADYDGNSSTDYDRNTPADGDTRTDYDRNSPERYGKRSSRNTSARNASSRKTSPRNYSSRNESSRRASSRNASSRNTSSRNASSRNASSRNTSPRNGSPGNTSPRNTSPRNYPPRNVSPKKISPGTIPHGYIIPTKMPPSKTPPSKINPSKIPPNKIPSNKIPPNKIPPYKIPPQMYPQKTPPEKISPGRMYPEKTYPGKIYPEKLPKGKTSSPPENIYNGTSSPGPISPETPETMSPESAYPSHIYNKEIPRISRFNSIVDYKTTDRSSTSNKSELVKLSNTNSQFMRKNNSMYVHTPTSTVIRGTELEKFIREMNIQDEGEITIWNQPSDTDYIPRRDGEYEKENICECEPSCDGGPCRIKSVQRLVCFMGDPKNSCTSSQENQHNFQLSKEHLTTCPLLQKFKQTSRELEESVMSKQSSGQPIENLSMAAVDTAKNNFEKGVAMTISKFHF